MECNGAHTKNDGRVRTPHPIRSLTVHFVRRLAALAAAASRSTAEPVLARPVVIPAVRPSDAPQPIDAEQLKRVGGGASAFAPVNRWGGA